MRYIFRADASIVNGVGHVMRLFPIAEELISRGCEVVFIGALDSVTWLKLQIQGLGFSGIHSEESDFKPNPITDVLILDTYTKDLSDRFILKGNWAKVVAVLDQYSPLYDADYVFSPDLNEKSLGYPKSKEFTGPRYIPLRKAINKSTRHFHAESELRIVCVGGGTDPTKFVDKVAKVLGEIKVDFQATLFTNDSTPIIDDVRFSNVRLGAELDFYAERADLIFTTASTSSLEFVAREVPIGIGCAVENQRYFYEKLVGMGAASPIGSFTDGEWHFDHDVIRKLVSSQDSRDLIKSNCKDLIDLSGAIRIANLIIEG